MISKSAEQNRPMTPSFLADGGEAGALVRSVDWSQTPLGPIESWSSSLKTTVGTLLHSRHPMFLWWGAELVQIYNDAYVPSFGKGKHPAAMGQRGRDCWQEIWPIIAPQIDDVMRRGRASWNEDHLVPIIRNGHLEEVYWTYGYSPVFDDDGAVGGTLVVCTETTSRVIGERRVRTLRKLAEQTAFAATPAEVMDNAVTVFADSVTDIPFALVYAFDTEAARLTRATGLSDEALKGFGDHYSRITPVELVSRPSYRALPVGVAASPTSSLGSLSDVVSEVFVAPLANRSCAGANGFIVFGISPLLPFDGRYNDFLVQISEQLVLAQARVEAFRIRAATEGERNNLLLQAPVPTALLTGPGHVFQLANPLYHEMVGNRALIGKRYVDAFPELIDTPLPGILDSVYRTGKPFVTKELLVALDRDGDGIAEDVFFQFNLEAMRDLDGNVYGMMAVAHDITYQVTSRLALEKAQLEREKLLADLEAASRAKDEFLAMLGHELRNPLSPIVTALELMKLRGQSSKEQVVIERQVTHLVRLVDDLLDISKITRGKVELRREWVEVSDVLAKAVEMASYLLEQRSHQLSIDVEPGLRWHGDPIRLAQVVSNLLTNAARYTDVAGRIRLAAAKDGHEVVISVKDNGTGLSAEMLPRIFDLFFQGKRNVDRAEGGLGIGLTLVKNLVALHGGTIAAMSEGLGKGSEFVIRLPADMPATAVSEANASVEVPRSAIGSQKRILVVDDNEDAAELLSEMLRTVGHDVAVANDPIAALVVAARFKPEIAVLDIGLPVMDGYELATKLQEIIPNLECRLIALTGYGQDHDRTRSEEAGFSAHLVKPVDMTKLLSLVSA
ncbi:MAG: response regulator [Myxococcales bacterium]|nr:response regulator [Myxococcales bacterium]